ncbi:histidine kinase [Nautilia sp. PV-1]|uniref:HDOD domain-containing protein n=1 Tax=Nautilia sp. PV-1 TaxID=2579250 RepID=UPI000FDBE392|nr:HDOD domain-containing protein [Nautilia sp. PV-1]AZV46957.1 histidine kinase [Nautilia sp. PV-1]
MNEKILNQIKSLPPLPKSVLEIQRITNDPNSSISDLIKIVKEDPMLTANLLKAANSPLYGFTRQIKNVDQAVSLFGMSTVKGFAISFAIRNSLKFDLSAYGINETKFHDVASQRNAIAINWFKRDRNRLDILATNSFLIDLGAVVISLILNNDGKSESFKNRLASGEDRESLEKEYVGATTTDVTTEIFKHWNFSDDLIESMSNINDPKGNYKTESAALLVLKTLVDMIKPFDDDSKKKAFELAENYGLDTEALQLAVDLVKG